MTLQKAIAAGRAPEWANAAGIPRPASKAAQDLAKKRIRSREDKRKRAEAKNKKNGQKKGGRKDGATGPLAPARSTASGAKQPPKSSTKNSSTQPKDKGPSSGKDTNKRKRDAEDDDAGPNGRPSRTRKTPKRFQS